MVGLPYNTNECCQHSFRENPEALLCASCHRTWELVNDEHRASAKEWVKENWVREGSNAEQFGLVELFAHGLALGEAKERIRKDEHIRKWADALEIAGSYTNALAVRVEMNQVYWHGKSG